MCVIIQLYKIISIKEVVTLYSITLSINLSLFLSWSRLHNLLITIHILHIMFTSQVCSGHFNPAYDFQLFNSNRDKNDARFNSSIVIIFNVYAQLQWQWQYHFNQHYWNSFYSDRSANQTEVYIKWLFWRISNELESYSNRDKKDARFISSIVINCVPG